MRSSRRTFISCASLAAAGNLLGLRPFGALNALAAPSNDYKALVCVFLFGGNDANNTLIPPAMDSTLLCAAIWRWRRIRCCP